MLRLKNRDLVVPEDGEGRNFRFLNPETKHWSEASDYYTWSERIRLHRKANGLREISMAEAEEQLCKGIPPEWCSRDKGDASPSVNTRFGWSELVEGMKAFAKVIFTGFVSQSEANRRASICGSCYFNINPSGCGTCNKMAGLITGPVAGRKTDYDASLKACAVCQCTLKSLVHFPLSALETSPEKQAAYPDFCWQKIGRDNYLPDAV